jgi:hypothetical protein
MKDDIRLTRLICAAIFVSWAVFFGGCTPLYLSDTHTTSTPETICEPAVALVIDSYRIRADLVVELIQNIPIRAKAGI